MNEDTLVPTGPCTEAIPQTIREQLQHRRTFLQRQMNDVDTAIAVLDKNPAFEEIHDTLNKLNVRGLLR